MTANPQIAQTVVLLKPVEPLYNGKSVSLLNCPPNTTYSTEEDFFQPVLQYDRSKKLWKLVFDYYFEWGKPGWRKRLYMKAGFEYDKASVPQFLWGFFRPDGPWEAAALWHDRLYRDKGQFKYGEFTFETLIQNGTEPARWEYDTSRWRRKDADELLEFVGVLGGASPSTARVYKTSVQVYPPNWFKGF